ncbi:MAG: fused MFS/spermidine synthase [Anaerolineales bacterium]
MKTKRGRSAPKETLSKSVLLAVLGCFFLSGMAGLIYQVVWTRRLTLVFGTTLHSVSAVVAVFMGGLALGSLIFGRMADRAKKPLLMFALLELAIGLYALLTPALIGQISSLQISLAQRNPGVLELGWLTIVLVSIVLLVPTILMGGTLPVMVKFISRSRTVIGNRVAQLNSLNTLGGAVGALLAGYVLIALLGISGTIYGAALINIAVGIVALSLQRKYGEDEQTWIERKIDPPKSKAEGGMQRRRTPFEPSANRPYLQIILLVGMGLSGFATLSLEISWTRVLIMVLGGSVYAFSTILTGFLLGIALGSLIATKFLHRGGTPWRLLAIVELLLFASVMMISLLMEQLPFWYLDAYRLSEGSFWAMQGLGLALVMVVILVPTTLMGTTFPIAAKAYAADLNQLGWSIGVLYFANTAGAVIGPLVTGFLLIPWVGLQTSILIAGLLFLAVGVTFLITDPRSRPSWKTVAMGIAAAGLVVGIAIPRWNPQIMGSGVYVYADEFLEEDDPSLVREKMVARELLFYREGLTATVAVSRSDDNLSLQINGKTDASTVIDADTELILGHLPMLLHSNPQRVLVVGLGSGMTLGAVELYPIDSVEAVEIEAAVVEAAGYFSEANHQALDDPRLHLVVDDARHYVLTSQNEYDVITAEPSNPWITGVSNLFTREQYEAYREKLTPGGIMFQWAHIYNMSEQDLRTLIATFQTVFPHTTLWQDNFLRDIFLVGTQQPLKIDFERLVDQMGRPEIRDDLARVGLDDPTKLLSHFFMDESSVAAFSEGAVLHTDNRPILEFSAPKNLFANTVSTNLEVLENYSSSIEPLLENIAGTPSDQLAVLDNLRTYVESRTHVIQGEIFLNQESFSAAIEEFEMALGLDPSSEMARFNLAELYRLQALNFSKLGMEQEAISRMEAVVEVNPEDLESQLNLGVLYGNTGQLEQAEAQFKDLIAIAPTYVLAHNNLAAIYHMMDRNSEALVELEISLGYDPNQPEVRERISLLKTSN